MKIKHSEFKKPHLTEATRLIKTHKSEGIKAVLSYMNGNNGPGATEPSLKISAKDVHGSESLKTLTKGKLLTVIPAYIVYSDIGGENLDSNELFIFTSKKDATYIVKDIQDFMD